MIEKSKWIWLNKTKYPNTQTVKAYFSKEYDVRECRFAEFQKELVFDKKIRKVDIEISADVKYFLYINEQYIGVGPVTPGGDYNSASSMPQHYYNAYETTIADFRLKVYVLVQTQPVVQCDMTQGRNGFVCAFKIFFADGTEKVVYSDDSWRCRLYTPALNAFSFDFTKEQDQWKNAEVISSVWDLFPSEIENTIEEKIQPQGAREYSVGAGEIKTISYALDKIYSGYYVFDVQADGEYQIDIYDYEKDAEKRGLCFTVRGDKDLSCRSVVMTSAGAFDVEIKNLGASQVTLKNLTFQFQHYPCLSQGEFLCSDEKLNKVYDMGRHALKICRQSIELDSPKHQENLQCAGDYHIASLMNYYADGDTKLTRFDIIRIARYLEMSDGYMFHTTYGLIWVQMVYEYYLHSGDVDILYFVQPALKKLLDRHAATTNEIGLIDNPLNYMFVDWIEVDGYTMHHPPKALGQTVINAFYYEALQKAGTIYKIIGEISLQKDCTERAKKLKMAFAVFYDEQKELYFDGLNDETAKNEWMPKNSDKRYYSWHSNALAVLYDLAPIERQKKIVKKMLSDNSLILPQPYFMHFVLEAIDKVGLFERYGMEQLNRWKYMTEFSKGLVEGWIHCASYGYDYSHVWAGTPTYQLPNKLSGLKILEAGFKKISLSPRLCGLDWAKISIPTPKGVIFVEMEKGKKTRWNVPSGIECVKD